MDYQPFYSPYSGQGAAPQPSAAGEGRDIKRDRKQLSVVALGTLFITVVTALAQIILLVPIQIFFPELMEESWFLVVASGLPMYAVAMPLSLLIYRNAKSEPPLAKKLHFGAWLGLLAICFALTYVGNFIGIGVNAIIEVLTGKPQTNELEQMTLQTPLWANLLVVGILAPVFEEIFYRKLVIDRLRTFGDMPAVLISGLLFGLLHGNFGQFFYATLIGFVFGMIYLRTGRLRYTVSLHMAINLLGGVLTSELAKNLDFDALARNPIAAVSESPIAFLLYMAYFGFLVLCLIGAPVALILLRKQIRFQKVENKPTARHWVRILICNPIAWLCFLSLCALFINL